MASLVKEVRHAVRSLLRTRSVAAAAVMALTIGVGATTTVFSVFYGVLLRPLPYPNAARIVQLVQIAPLRAGQTEATRGGISPEQLREWESQTLSAVAVYSPTAAMLNASNESRRLLGARVSPALFSILGVRPLIGRTFLKDEEQDQQTIILAHHIWVGWFGSDRQILERTISLSNRIYRVVGVMPRNFDFPELGRFAAGSPTRRVGHGPDFWLPYPASHTPTSGQPGFSLVPAIALIRQGVTLQRATAEANSSIPALPNGKKWRVELADIRDESTRQIRPVLKAFQLGVLFVLLIACFNIMNLLLARAARRRQELAIRVALGARGHDIARQVIAEALVLSLAGGVGGWFLAHAGISATRSLPADLIPRLDGVRLDVPVLLFSLGLSLASGIVIGAAVTFRVLRSRPWKWLRGAGSQAAEMMTTKGRSPSRALVVASITTAVVLLAAAGLLLNSFVQLLRVDVGFDTAHLLTFQIALPSGSRYVHGPQRRLIFKQLAAALQELPSVDAATVASAVPFRLAAIGSPLRIPGQGASSGGIAYRVVMPGYFRTLRVPLIRGREFEESDREDQPRVIVVNQALARRYFHGMDPLGEYVEFIDATRLRIVGIARDSKASRLDSEPMPEIYYPYEQSPQNGVLSIAGMMRTSPSQAPMGLLPNVRSIVKQLDPDLGVYDAVPMNQVVSESLASFRLYTFTAIACGATALLLAMIGLYGVLSYDVSTRTHEIGIRMALGADSRTIISGVLREGLLITVIGLALGLGAAMLVSGSLQALLFSVRAHDPATYTFVSMLFLAVAVIACYLPARAATRLDPLDALRYQ